jgi:hypothetical protein
MFSTGWNLYNLQIDAIAMSLAEALAALEQAISPEIEMIGNK